MNKAPDAFRTISEVAAELDLPQHVLRFWESRFPHIRPMKRGGGRRYYRPDDVELLRGVRHLLYGQGYTIRGVQRILREQGPRFVQTVWQEGAPQPGPPAESDLDEREEAGAAGPLDAPLAIGGGGAAPGMAADPPAAEPRRSGPPPAADRGPGPLAVEPERSGGVAPGESMDTATPAELADSAPAAAPDSTAPDSTAPASTAPAPVPPASVTAPPVAAAPREDWQAQPPAATASVRQLSPIERDVLQSALETLQSCRRLLDDALAEAEPMP